MKNSVMQSTTCPANSIDQMEKKAEERKTVAKRDRCISNKDRKRSIKMSDSIPRDSRIPTRHTNYYEVLSDVPCGKEDDLCYHEEISLDQKAIRRCKKSDQIYGATKVHATSRPKFVQKRNVVSAKMTTQGGTFTDIPSQLYTGIQSQLPKSWQPRKPALQRISEGLQSVEMFMKLIPEDLRTGAELVFNLYVSLNHLRYATSLGDFITRLYLGMKSIWKDATVGMAKRLWDALKEKHGKMGTQASESPESFWRKANKGLSSMWTAMEGWFGCPSMDLILDLMSIISFSGFFGEKAFDFVKDHGFNEWHRKITERVRAWPDIFSVCINLVTMVTDAVATYFEDGTLDFFGWKYGKRRDIFNAYNHLVNESADAIGRRLDDAKRPESAVFKSQQAYITELARVTDATGSLIRKGTVHERNVYSRMYGELLRIQAEMTEFHRSSSARIKPYTFCVCGVTSSMKSTVSQAVWRQIAVSNGITTDMTNQVTVNFKDQYFSEVKAQEVLIMDDFMNTKPGVVQEGVSPIRVLLDWSSNVAVQIPSAAVEEKGKRYCNAKVLGLTCHSKEFHAEAYSYQPEAAYRRVEIFIETHLRSAYKAPDGRPDYAKIPKTFFPDVWDFKLYTVKINGADWCFDRVGGPDKVFNNQELMSYLSTDSTEHFLRQKELTERMNSCDWFCGHNQVRDSCVFCNPANPPRAQEPEPLTKTACRAYLAYAMPRSAPSVRKRVLEEAWDILEQFPDQTWADSYLEDMCRIFHERGDDDNHLDLDMLDEEYMVRLREYTDLRESCKCKDVNTSPPTRDSLQVSDLIHTLEDGPLEEVFTPERVEMNRRYHQSQSSSDGGDSTSSSDGSYSQPPLAYTCMDEGEREALIPRLRPETPPTDLLSEPPPVNPEDQIEMVLRNNVEVDFDDPDTTRLLEIMRNTRVSLQSWETEVIIDRISLTQTIFTVRIDDASDDVVNDIVADAISWLAVRRLGARLDTDIYEDAIRITATHDEYTDELLPMGTQGRLARDKLEEESKREYTWFDDAFKSKYPRAKHPADWAARMKKVRESNTISGWIHSKVADRVERNAREKRPFDWTLCGFMTAFNTLGYAKHLMFALGCCGVGIPLLVTYMIASFCDYKRSGASSSLSFFAMWSVRQLKTLARGVWNVDDAIDSWMSTVISRDARVRWYLDWNPDVKNDLTRRVLINWKAPSTFDILFGQKRRVVSVAVKMMAISAGLASLWLLWREYIHLEPVALTEEYIEVFRDEVAEMKVTNQVDEGMVQPLPGEQKDCWLKVGPPVVQLTEASHTTTPTAFRQIVQRNIAICEVKYMKGDVPMRAGCYGFSVGGSDWIIPTHLLCPGIDEFTIYTRYSHHDTIDDKIASKFCRQQCVELGDTDFTLVRLKSAAPRRIMVDYFPEGDCSNVYASLLYIKDDKLVETDCRRMPKPRKIEIEHRGQPYKTLEIVHQTSYPIETDVGLCGAMWVANPNTKPFIHSFHICGNAGTKIGGSQVICRSLIVEAIQKLNEVSGLAPVDEGNITPEMFGPMEIHASINATHPINFTVPTSSPPIATIIGTHTQHSGKYCQNIIPTAIADGLTQRLGWEQAFKAVPAPNSTRHLRKGLEEILHPRVMIDAGILMDATNDLRKHILDYVDAIPDLSKSVVPLVPVVVVSGQDGVLGVDKMNPSTSAGFPERGAKGRFYVKTDPVDGVTDPYVLDEEHMQRISEIEETLASGKRVYAPFTLSVKIEPTKVTKEYARLFGASNMCFTYLFRKYFLSIFRLIQLNPYQFGTALGINCHSGDWDSLYHVLTWKDRIIEGDYATYDKTMSPAVILDIFSILIAIARRAKYSERQLRIMNGLAYEVAFPTYEARGLLFVASGSNPSGHPGTFIINTLVCSLYARYCFFKELKTRSLKIEYPFSHYVKEVTAGDDHLFSVSPECTWFDQHVMQRHLASADIGYTDGKKNKDIPTPFIHINDASFVSRGFRYCTYLKRWVGPLAVKSLKKSYMIHNLPQKNSQHPNDLIATVVEQNLVELFFHGEEAFDRMDKAVRESMAEAGLGHLCPPPITFQEVGELIKERTQPGFMVDLRSGDSIKYHPPDVIIGKVDDPYIMEITESL